MRIKLSPDSWRIIEHIYYDVLRDISTEKDAEDDVFYERLSERHIDIAVTFDKEREAEYNE